MGNFLTSWKLVSFSRRTLLHGVSKRITSVTLWLSTIDSCSVILLTIIFFLSYSVATQSRGSWVPSPSMATEAGERALSLKTKSSRQSSVLFWWLTVVSNLETVCTMHFAYIYNIWPTNAQCEFLGRQKVSVVCHK